MVDPNKLPTTRKYDSLGRLGLEKRPDGSQTTIILARTKGGGPQQNAWRVTKETTTTGGADDTDEYDSLSREVRWWWHGPDTGGVARVMQEIAFDVLGEHVARRSVPDSEGTPEAQLLNDTYQYDALGREVFHTTPWGPALPTSYSGLQVTATDALMNPTVTVLDPLGRAVTVTDAAGAPTAYVYGPFGQLYTVTAPGNALTRTTRDAYGRVRQLDDPNRGTTTTIHDGFGELMSSTDALGRVVTYQVDALGRTLSRLDQNGAETLTTSWTWDTAPHGIGKLASLVGPDGTKSYTYTAFSQLQTLTLDLDVPNGEPERLVGSLTYDNVGRVQTITYPAPGGASFVVDQQFDAYGHILTVEDDSTKKPYWQLTAVDGAGRFKSETFGNGATTTRAYFPDKQRLQSITTTSGATSVQSLTYSYDARLDLQSRSDANQQQNTTEWFRYDPVERLTCAYFSAVENDSAPCGIAYGYHPSGNGNLTSKSDVGALSYGDPAHPHAVTSAGTDAFSYNAVGNQTSRPGATIDYTPFDLPKTITQSAGAITFAYDGDEQRILKSTPTEETLYFGDLYQRDTVTGSPSAHRYYVHSPERVVAVVTVGGTAPGTVYVHVDHLGSVDVLTNESGTPVEKRSYDPFGQRRNPAWGQPPPATFPNLTTVAFTGQEADSELGLVNMKGRVYDPRTGRFLTTDPVVSDPLSAQRWNAYSYVLNNPLNFIDPTGLDEVLVQIPLGAPPSQSPPATAEEEKEKQKKEKDVDISQALTAGATRLPTDVGTSGGGRTAPPRPAATIASAVKGFATGVYWFYTPNPLPYLKAVTGITLADNAVKGARDDGAIGAFAGAVNTINPLYHWGVGVVDTQQKAAAGDTEGAVQAGTAVVLGIATMGGALVGAGGPAPTTGEIPQLGGSYSAVRTTASEAGLGGQVHHMPAWAATRDAGMPGVTRGNSPSIWMREADHAMTPSFRSSAAAQAYRAQQQALIQSGRYLDALKMDVDAIRSTHGTVYDGAIQQMGEYLWSAWQ
jgi:RHS repeat-associated protein